MQCKLPILRYLNLKDYGDCFSFMVDGIISELHN